MLSFALICAAVVSVVNVGVAQILVIVVQSWGALFWRCASQAGGSEYLVVETLDVIVADVVAFKTGNVPSMDIYSLVQVPRLVLLARVVVACIVMKSEILNLI